MGAATLSSNLADQYYNSCIICKEGRGSEPPVALMHEPLATFYFELEKNVASWHVDDVNKA